MRTLTLLLALTAALATAASAAPKKQPKEPKEREVPIRSLVRLAPDFSFPGPGSRGRTLRALRGQPVVLLIAESPRTKAFRKQLGRLDELYSEFAARGTVFIAAFSREGEGPVKSDLPFVVANNGPAVAAAYGMNDDFNIIIIGKDGNVDYQTPRVIPASRVRDVIQNSYTVQQQVRK